MKNIFFFQTQQIPDDTILFDEFKQQNIFYSYFQIDQNYYLFLYAQQSIDINLLYQSVEVVQELDSKQRKIRSLRGFFLYALEIMENGKEYEILETNLQPFFWKKVENIIRQNKKAALQEFLFKSHQESNVEENIKIIQNLETQVYFLYARIIGLKDEYTDLKKELLEQLENALSKAVQRLESSITTQQGDSTLKSEQLLGNENEREVKKEEILKSEQQSNILSEAPKINETASLTSQQYNGAPQTPKFKQISSNQEKARNEEDFTTLSKISEEDKIQIFKTGFRRKLEGKISWKKYYESKDPDSLFQLGLLQLEGYNKTIKYESARRDTLYKELKDEFDI